jgi:hypothetical protein
MCSDVRDAGARSLWPRGLAAVLSRRDNLLYLSPWQAAGVQGDVIETRTAKIWMGEDGVLRGSLRAGADEQLEDAAANVEAAASLAGDRKVPVLIDLRHVHFISQDARRFYAGKRPAKYSLALALVIGSPLSKLMGNFFLWLNKPPFPTKLFTSEQDAIDWLKEQAQ